MPRPFWQASLFHLPPKFTITVKFTIKGTEFGNSALDPKILTKVHLICDAMTPTYHKNLHDDSAYRFTMYICTDGSRILHTLLVKHFNTLLDRLNSERDKDEVTYFYVGDIFCIHLGIKYADFQEKIFAGISGKKF